MLFFTKLMALLLSMGLASTPNSLAKLKNGDPVRDEDKIGDIDPTEPSRACEVLVRDGVVRLNGCLNGLLCDECSVAIDEALAFAVALNRDYYVANERTGFGNVDASSCRWDMFLDGEKECHSKALSELLAESTPLNVLFEALFQSRDALVYEFASLISDGGAESQRIHPDTTWQATGCSTFTCFVALQDINTDMGPTHFIKGSHTKDAHQSLRHNRDNYLSESMYCRAGLKRGDAVVMDSRLFHCGGANESNANGAGSRRTLLYFTLLNPDFADGPGEGSKFESLHLSLHGIRDSRKLKLASTV